jgi:hypothetical protein
LRFKYPVVYVSSPALSEHRIVVVGAGMFGATLAERVANEADAPV